MPNLVHIVSTGNAGKQNKDIHKILRLARDLVEWN